jgi:heme-degrading monooxygenase HmoA
MGEAMFARITKIKVKIDKIEEASKLFKESVIPMFKSQKGYKGAYYLAERNKGECICISLWDKENDAIANEESLLYQEQLIKFMNFMTANPTKEGYEIFVED